MFLGTVAIGLGQYLSKVYTNTKNIYLLPVVVIVYMSATISWLGMMKYNNQLALMTTIWGVGTTLVGVCLGIFVFKETLTITQWIGIGLALISTYLLTK